VTIRIVLAKVPRLRRWRRSRWWCRGGWEGVPGKSNSHTVPRGIAAPHLNAAILVDTTVVKPLVRVEIHTVHTLVALDHSADNTTVTGGTRVVVLDVPAAAPRPTPRSAAKSTTTKKRHKKAHEGRQGL
jgi:hypothetical protein